MTNFTSAGILDPNQSQVEVQQALRQSSPLSTEEWVCVEDYYSDEGQSEGQAAQVSKEILAHPIVSTVSPQFTPATVAASELSAYPSAASLVSLFASLVATAPQSVSQVDQSVSQLVQLAGTTVPPSDTAAL